MAVFPFGSVWRLAPTRVVVAIQAAAGEGASSRGNGWAGHMQWGLHAKLWSNQPQSEKSQGAINPRCRRAPAAVAVLGAGLLLLHKEAAGGVPQTVSGAALPLSSMFGGPPVRLSRHVFMSGQAGSFPHLAGAGVAALKGRLTRQAGAAAVAVFICQSESTGGKQVGAREASWCGVWELLHDCGGQLATATR